MEEDTANDEELARALSEQFEAEEAALRASRSQNMNIPVVMATVENEPYLHQHQPSSPVISSQFMDDELRLSEAFANSSPEEIARRVAQEEEDAALAARLAQQDANFASTRGTTPRQAPITEADIQRRRTARRKQSMRSALTCILGKQLQTFASIHMWIDLHFTRSHTNSNSLPLFSLFVNHASTISSTSYLLHSQGLVSASWRSYL